MSLGFPEPFFKQSEEFHRLWKLERENRVIREDLLDLEVVRNLNLVEQCLMLLPSKVGSVLSIRSIQEDLFTTYPTVNRTIEIFEALYLVFRIYPFGAPKVKSIKKEAKIYFWDWSSIEDGGARLENFVASCLLRFCHETEDFKGYKMELRYLRTKDRKEIDFVVMKDRKPYFGVECKTKSSELFKSISYFYSRTEIKKFFQIHMDEKDYGDEDKGGRVLPLLTFLKILKTL